MSKMSDHYIKVFREDEENQIPYHTLGKPRHKDEDYHIAKMAWNSCPHCKEPNPEHNSNDCPLRSV